MKTVPLVPVLAFLASLVLLALLVTLTEDREPEPSTRAQPSAAQAAPGSVPGLLYGRVTVMDGAVYEGRLRWGGDEEALWGHFFNGSKAANPWAGHVPPEKLLEARPPLEILGFEIVRRDRPIELDRPLMARFGDIARIEARGTEVRVILKSGTEFDVDRLGANDFDDGVRVWDRLHGMVDLPSRQIASVEFLAPSEPSTGPVPLYGTVWTAHGDFTGHLQWHRRMSVGSDLLVGRAGDGEVSLRFDTIRSISRDSSDSSRILLRDSREIVLSGSRANGDGNLGIYVDDQRYGRVLVSWDAFERVDFRAEDSGAGDSGAGNRGPAYDDFAPGSPLEGSVTTRAGRSLRGRLVFDLDESETTETLDAPSRGVDYIIPFGRISLIEPTGLVTLHSWDELQLEPTGDLGKDNAGLLIFADGQSDPDYVPWNDVERIDLNQP